MSWADFNRRLRRFVVACSLFLGIFSSCGDDTDFGTGPGVPGDGGEITTLQSAKERSSADVSARDLNALVSGNTAFALDLYQLLSSTSDNNLLYSPYSISLALAMVWAGAREETDAQMANVLHVTLPSEQQHAAFNALDRELETRGQNVQPSERGSRFQLSITNSIWSQRDFQFEQDFLDLLAEQYGATMRLVDFVAFPDQSRLLINEWVKEQAEDRIEDLLPEGSITNLTRLVLANAVYFKASWLHPFEPSETADGQFSTLDGRSVTAKMMNQSLRTVYAEGDDFQAVELPYVCHDASMIIIMPAVGSFEAFESTLDGAAIIAIVENLRDTRVTLSLPRFEFEAHVELADRLKEMGMSIAFEQPGSDSGADFSGMDGRRDLFIHDVQHKAFIAVDEEGTEAEASTAVIVGEKSATPSATIVMDQPFLFLVRDRETGTVLFMGRVVDPTV